MADRLDYTQRDESIALTRIQRIVRSIYPNWDFNKKDFGNAILAALAWLMGVLSWLTDFWAREALPTEATLRRSVTAHARWIGYTPKGRTAATVPVTLALASAHPEDITLPAGTQFSVPSTGAPLIFQLQSGVALVSPTLSVSGTLEHSETVTEVEVSSERPWQQIRLAQSPFIPGTLTVSAANGSYTLVDNLLQSAKTDRHCYVEIDDDERPVVLFGDGKTGEIPTGNISFSYKVGGGLEGNVEPTTWDAVFPISDIAGGPVNLTVTSSVAASGGSDGETLAEVKSNAVANLTTRNRTVTREDYENVAQSVSGVARALCLSAAEWALIREGEAVVWIVARGKQLPSGRYEPDNPTSGLLQDVETAWGSSGKPTSLHVRSRAVGLSGSHLKSIDVTVTVYLEANPPVGIGQTIFDALRDFFAVELEDGSPNPKIRFGYYSTYELPWSDVFNVVRDIEGVRKIDRDGLLLNGTTGDIALALYQIPKLGAVTIKDQNGTTLSYVVT